MSNMRKKVADGVIAFGLLSLIGSMLASSFLSTIAAAAFFALTVVAFLVGLSVDPDTPKVGDGESFVDEDDDQPSPLDFDYCNGFCVPCTCGASLMDRDPFDD